MRLIISLLCVFFMTEALAGLFSNDQEKLRDAVESGHWKEAYRYAETLSAVNGAPKDLYAIVQALALSRQNKLAEIVKALEPIQPDSLYYLWAQLFLARTAYLSHNNPLLEMSLKTLKNVKLKGEFQIEKQYYEAYLLTEKNEWKNAYKTLSKIERPSRGTDLHVPVLMARAQSEAYTVSAGAVCETLKKIYVEDPIHPWFEQSAPQIVDVPIGNKKYSCLVSDKEFNQRRRSLNLLNKFEAATAEMKKWFAIHSTGLKEQVLMEAQQKMAEGHADVAIILLKEFKEGEKDASVLSPLSFAAARLGDMKTAVDASLELQKLFGIGSKKGTMALYQAAVWSYQMRDYDQSESMFRKINMRHLSVSYRKEVQWYKGWLRYLKKDYYGAEMIFRNLQNPNGRRRAIGKSDRLVYWLAMTLLRQDKSEKARVLLQSLTKTKTPNYYALLAKERLNRIPDNKKRSIAEVSGEEPTINVLSQFLYPTPFYHWAPRPSEKESETNDELLASGLEEESALIAEENSALAGEEIKTEAKESEPPSKVAEAGADLELFSNNEANQKLERARGFWSVGLADFARKEVSDLERYSKGQEVYKKLIEEYRQLNLYNKLSILGSRGLGKGDLNSNRSIYEATFPQAYNEFVMKYAGENNIYPALVWAIMKAESMYRPWVKSPVGALGLMQVMPSTGLKLSQIMDDSKFAPENLLQPEQAIRYGSRYLERMSKKFDRSLQLIAAAYNAGPHRVSQWLHYFGYMEMDEWVEHIPFLETRNYVKRVTVNYSVYSSLYGKTVGGPGLNLVGAIPVQVAGAPEIKESWD